MYIGVYTLVPCVCRHALLNGAESQYLTATTSDRVPCSTRPPALHPPHALTHTHPPHALTRTHRTLTPSRATLF